MTTEAVQQAAAHARRIGEELAKLVGEKQLVYGDAAGLQAGLWRVLLAQFAEEGVYVVPKAFMEYDVPRLTRVFDRVARIIARSHEGGDAMGESPWRDLAGDAIVGASVQARRQGAQCTATHPHTGRGCERTAPHGIEDEHRYVHAGGVMRWTYSTGANYASPGSRAPKLRNDDGDDPVCGSVDPETGRTCTRKPSVHPDGHKHYARPDAQHAEGHGWWGPELPGIPVDEPEEYDNQAYTHGYTPEED